MVLQAVSGEKGLSQGKWRPGLMEEKCIHLKMKQYYFTVLDICSWVPNYFECIEASKWCLKQEYSTLCHLKFNNNLITGIQESKGISFGPQFNLLLAVGYKPETIASNKVTRQVIRSWLCHPKTPKSVLFFHMQWHFPIKNIFIM